MLGYAVVFDCDGVLIDNIPYHKMAWKEFCSRKGLRKTDDELAANAFGKRNSDILAYLFQTDERDARIASWSEEKEAIYQELYRQAIRPAEGLLQLLRELRDNGVAIGMATTSPRTNIDFMFRHIPIRDYFHTIIDDSMILNGKPDPEIYLKATAALDYAPSSCIAFEDSKEGTESASKAGLTVIGLTTTSIELPHTQIMIPDFTHINHAMLEDIIKK